MSKVILIYSILSIFVTSGQAEVCPTPSTKNNGVWWCNEDQFPSSYCYLKCDPGYAALYTSTSCISGIWTDLDKMECEQSVFLLIGGEGYAEDKNISTEIFHDMENVTCTNHLPYVPILEDSFDYRGPTTFVYNGLLYICGNYFSKPNEDHNYRCASLNMTDQSEQWKNHFFPDEIYLSEYKTVILRDKLYFFDEYHFDYPSLWTTLPLENEPKLNRVRNLPFLYGVWDTQIVQTTGDSFIAIVRDENIYRYNKPVMNSNVSTAIITEYPRSKELHEMAYYNFNMECIVAEEGGKQWLIMVGTLDALSKAVRLNLNDGQWELLGELNVPRVDFRMGVTGNGIFAMGGVNTENYADLNTVEMFDWESKKWNIIEKKLNGARYQFGKVEIPASIFNCEKIK